MDASAWSAQLLTEFIAAVSAAETEAAAARAAVEHAAEALDADVAAIVCGGELVAAVGYPQGRAPAAELGAVRPGAADAWLQVPGTGSCAAAAATLEHPPGATIVLARSGPGGWSREETGLLGGMARVTAMTMRMLHMLDAGHAMREEAGRLVREQAALQRVAALVAKAASPGEIFSAVAEEVGQVLPGADIALVGRYGSGQAIEFVGGWTKAGEAAWVGHRVGLGGRNVATLVFETSAPARVDRLADDAAAATAVARGSGARSSAGAPISVGGRLWGVMTVASIHEDGLPAGTEHRLAGFTELVATAIANAQAREELRRVADEQAALRRVATLVARGEPPSTVFAAVAEEVGGLFPAEAATVARYDPDVTVAVGSWSRTGEPATLGTRIPRGGQNVTTLVFETGRPARIDRYAADDPSSVTATARSGGMRSAIGAPIIVEGRLWGLMALGSPREAGLAPGMEERLAAFAELAATAIANAEAHEELRRVADEQAALRRVATLVGRVAPPEEVFAAVTDEAGRLLGVDYTAMSRYDRAGARTIVAAWARSGAPVVPVGTREILAGQNVPTLVFQTGRPARIDRYGEDAGPAAAAAVAAGVRAAVGVPISVEGRLWGLMNVYSTHEEPLPADTEARLAGFTELVATAIANAQARMELRRVADEQAALQQVATLVARGEPAAVLFAAVAKEVGALFGSDVVGILRFGPDGEATLMGRDGMQDEPGARGQLPARSAAASVQRTGQAARVDADGTTVSDASAVSAPIVVKGQLWGVIGVARHGRLPPDTEQRVAGFTELVATAIANAEAQAELTASRARIVATTDQTRRRIERDLHDGAQQRLVSLTLQLRAAQAAMPPQLGELGTELGRVAAGLNGALDELREYARGIHPAILAERGLGPALKTLARHSPIPVDLQVQVEGRLPERVEVSAYYVVSEALANAAKHAHASAITVAAEASSEVLRVVVRDDGAGGADFTRGTGLVGLKDRVEALGGKIFLDSPRAAGTTLHVELPLTGSDQATRANPPPRDDGSH
ncbi:MAG TPA: GAF domain-containing protein [Streptosporangiaceae bacterium]|nr:GAF domain-containing protein [Streptosporangiaceae bacterium]